MKEIWKPIPNYEKYEVSNLGRVRNITTNKILKPIEDKYGYLTVGLYNENNPINHYAGRQGRSPVKKKIHTLVATAFCECPDDGVYRVPDHIDRNKHNNRADNLRWATRSENAKNIETTKKKRMSRYFDPIVLIYEGEIVERFKSCEDASKKTGLTVGSIARNILGRRKSFTIGDFALDN